MKDNGMYALQGELRNKKERLNVGTNTNMDELLKIDGVQLWHQRLGHAGKECIVNMERNGSVAGIHTKAEPEVVECEPCAAGKQKKTSQNKELVTTDTKVGEICFTDLCGPCKALDLEQEKYFIILIDGNSRQTTVKLQKKKEE